MIDALLRPGSGETLFMISGAGGAAEELAGLAETLDGDPRVIGLVPVPAPGDTAPITVEAMAERGAALMRLRQPDGPYRLLGYSLGGLIALETGRLLREAGERVSFLGLIDAPFDQRYWPTALFVSASVRRAAVHAKALLHNPQAEAGRDLGQRIRRLAMRVRARFVSRGGEDAPVGLAVEEANYAAIAGWQPRVIGGPVVLFNAEETDFGCDLAKLWRPWLPGMQVRRVPGSHRELVRDPDGVSRLAKAVDQELVASEYPQLHVLVAT